MSNYAKHLRRGAGPQTGGGPPLLTITRAQKSGTTNAFITWSGTVFFNVFSVGDFTTQPSGHTSIFYSQINASRIAVGFSGNNQTDTQVLYTGVHAGLATPQTVPYT